MAFATVPALVAELAAGRMVVVAGDEETVCGGTVIVAADHVSAEAINFMARHCRGLICLALTHERCDALQLGPIPAQGGVRGSAFTVSIEATSGISTGISAADRARTIQAAIDPHATPASLARPGHIFPLRAQRNGVFARPGHTEAGCDLARLAGRTPAAVLCYVMNGNGHIASGADLNQFATTHGLPLGIISDLVRYRCVTEVLIDEVSARPLHTPLGTFMLRRFHDHFGGVHLALTVGTWSAGQAVPVVIHRSATALDVLDLQPTCGERCLPADLLELQTGGCGVALLLDVESHASTQHLDPQDDPPRSPQSSALLVHGIGLQILSTLNVAHSAMVTGITHDYFERQNAAPWHARRRWPRQ